MPGSTLPLRPAMRWQPPAQLPALRGPAPGGRRRPAAPREGGSDPSAGELRRSRGGLVLLAAAPPVGEPRDVIRLCQFGGEPGRQRGGSDASNDGGGRRPGRQTVLGAPFFEPKLAALRAMRRLQWSKDARVSSALAHHFSTSSLTRETLAGGEIQDERDRRGIGGGKETTQPFPRGGRSGGGRVLGGRRERGAR